jgi:branched-chain amino acid transport system substrate-binding protein
MTQFVRSPLSSHAARRRRRLLRTSLAVVLLTLLAACGDSDSDSNGAATTAVEATTTTAAPTDEGDGSDEVTAPSGDPIVIGVVEAKSGGAAFYAAQANKMLELAVDAVNDGVFLDAADALPTTDPGILGRPVELIFEDDQGDPNLTVVRTRRLLERGADLILFNSGSSSAVQGRVVCQEEQVWCMAANNVSGAILEPPNTDFIFTLAPPSGSTVKVFIDVFQQQGYQTIAYNSDDTATGQLLKDAYKGAFEAAGFTTVADEVVAVGATDISGQVLRMRDADPDVVFDMSQTATEGGLFFRTSARLMPDVQRFATNSVTAQPEMWEIGGADGMDGLLVIDNLDPSNPYTQQVQALFEERYGSAPFLFIHGMNWDALMLIKAAVESAGSTEGTAVRDAFEQITDFPSAHGQPGYTVSWSPENHNGSSVKGHAIVIFNGLTPETWPVFQP